MKKIDIEKIERKNIYSTPDHFYDEIQQNVLNIVKNYTVNRASEIPYWKKSYWLAAASIVLVFISFYIWNNNGIKNEDSKKKLNFAENFSFEKSNEREVEILINDLSKSISVEKTSLNNKNLDEREIINNENMEDFVVLEDFSNDEDLIYTLEQDIYLDLFN